MTDQPDTAMRLLFTALAATALAACQPTIPDSAAGVGFQDYDSYVQEREARLRGDSAQTQGDARAGQPLSAIPDARTGQDGAALDDDDGARIARDALAAISPGRNGDDRAGAGDAVSNGRSAIENDQDYQEVLRREGEASDQDDFGAGARGGEDLLDPVIPQPIPEREGRDAPNIVAYALRTSNRVGEQIYDRSGLFAESRFQRNCAEYNTQEEAQEDFLRRGGPERDPRGLDPNGDGFACWWDPEPYRAAARAAD